MWSRENSGEKDLETIFHLNGQTTGLYVPSVPTPLNSQFRRNPYVEPPVDYESVFVPSYYPSAHEYAKTTDRAPPRDFDEHDGYISNDDRTVSEYVMEVDKIPIHTSKQLSEYRYFGICMIIFGLLTMLGSMLYCVSVCQKEPSKGSGSPELYWTHHWKRSLETGSPYAPK